MNIFISYSHSNKDKADLIEKGLSQYGLSIVRDERELSLNKNIKEFMQKIKETDYAILIISDAFLKSQYCMYEVLELLQTLDYEKRLIPIITEDAKIYSAEDISDYLEYWDAKKESLDSKFQNQKSRVHSAPILEELSHFDNIRDSIANFIDHLRVSFHYSFEEMNNLQFVPVIEYVDVNIPIDVEKKS